MAGSSMAIGGHTVDYFDSRTTPGGEMGAMDVIEQTKLPSILKSSEGDFVCWIDGYTAGRFSTLGAAQNAMRSLLR